MKHFSTKNFGLPLIVLLAIFLLVAVIPPHVAQAVTPVTCPVCDVWGVNISVQSTSLNFQWNNKNFLLNVGGVLIARTIIDLLRDYIINAIATGQFGKPQFVASFFADPSRWGENAARLFLSQITGINFCNYNLNIPQIASVRISLSFDLQCNVNSFRDLSDTLFSSPATMSLVDELLLEDHDPIYEILLTHQKALEAERRARKAKRDEALTGMGWLGKRLGLKGKINTPGSLVVSFLTQSIESDYRKCDTATEFQQVIANCALSAVVDIINAGTGKLINGFLGESFPAP